MKQTRLASLIETTLSTAAGFGLAVLLQATVLPLMGVTISIEASLSFAGVMTVASIARQYLMRRLFESLQLRVPLSPALHAVIAERRRQIDSEGWTSEHDDANNKPGDLAAAGACYAMFAAKRWDEWEGDPMDLAPPLDWPWLESGWWKPTGARRDLIKAAALIVAEIDCIDRHRRIGRLTKREQRQMRGLDQWTAEELARFGRVDRPPIVYNKNDSTK